MSLGQVCPQPAVTHMGEDHDVSRETWACPRCQVTPGWRVCAPCRAQLDTQYDAEIGRRRAARVAAVFADAPDDDGFGPLPALTRCDGCRMHKINCEC